MLTATTVKQVTGVNTMVSPPMAEAIRVWAALYTNQADWLDDNIRSLNLPAAIAGEIAQAMTVEMQVEVTGGARAAFLQQSLAPVLGKMRAQVEKSCALGGLVMKPYLSAGQVLVDFVPADMFYPTAFDSSGNLAGCVFVDQKFAGEVVYTRLEYHTMTEAGCLIRNLAYRSQNKDMLGSPCPLDQVDAWAGLEPEAVIAGIERPLFAYFRYPLVNNIDPSSPLGVSCYARAVDLVEQADRLWSNLLWEFESGKRAIYVDTAAFQREANGRLALPDKRLYRALNASGNLENEDLFKEWSPELREAAIRSGLNTVLKRIEFNCGLAYGTLSDPQSVEKTATEIAAARQRSQVTIANAQQALQQALEQLLWAMDIWATLGQLAPRSAWHATFMFDDSLVVDQAAQFQNDLNLVRQGIMSKVEFRMRNFGEDEPTAQARVTAAQNEQPAVELGF